MNSDMPATKADLKEVESRLDAKIDGLDAKIDGVEKSLGSRINGLAGALVKTNSKMDRMEERLSALIRDESGKTAARIDVFLGKLQTYERESHMFPKTLDEHGATLRDHERRLSSIETSRTS